MSEKPHRIRVRTLDGAARDAKQLNRLRSNQLGMPHLDIVPSEVAAELIICASREAHIEQVRTKLASAGLEEIEGDTTVPTAGSPQRTARHAGSVRGDDRRGASRHSSRWSSGRERDTGTSNRRGSGPTLTPETDSARFEKKPYAFAALPSELTTAAPVWHDGSSSQGRLSGEVRFELEALTPLLAGCEREMLGGDTPGDWPLESMPEGEGHALSVDGSWTPPVAAKKSVLCPLRAPWGERPVIIPADSLKGLLRHELGALLGAPMERVAERSYSYRPNALFPNQPDARLVPRLAYVREDGVETMPLEELGRVQVRVPTRLDLLPANLEYNKKANKLDFQFDQPGGAPYHGGQGAGVKLNSKSRLHHSVKVLRAGPIDVADVPAAAQQGYLATLRHTLSPDHGHFAERHPDVPRVVRGDDARARILDAARSVAFQPGDIVWVEWDTKRHCIVSFGWHYYYRWAYLDSVRKRGGTIERSGLLPLEAETTRDTEGAPVGLSAVRRLFGYTGDNDGSRGIGGGDHEQLMGRLFPNAAIEVVASTDTEESRFLERTFLKVLGLPRPSAVEHYLKQPHHPRSRPSDRAKLVTYGDAAGYDEGGELAGRKLYLDRADAYTSTPWSDESEANRLSEHSTLALEASKPGRRFRFTLRFRDVDAAELAAVLVALCPDQLASVLGGAHVHGYCSKLGYARPLGWGSVRIEAKALLWLDAAAERPSLTPEPDLPGWVKRNHVETASQHEWLAIHRRRHPDAVGYPTSRDRDGNESIYTFHTKLRAEHSRARRYSGTDS